MNAVEKIQQKVKSALHEAVIKAELTEEANMPACHARNTKK